MVNIRDSITSNRVHQLVLIQDFNERKFEYSTILKEAWVKLEQYGADDCILDMLYVSIWNGFIKMSYMLIALVFAIFV